jgi:hypothetical protein
VRRGELVPLDGLKVRKPLKRLRKVEGKKKKHLALTENKAVAKDEEEEEESED